MNLLNPVSTIMTPNPISIGVDEPLAVADKLFKQHRIHHLPVIAEGALVGMISKSDFSFFRRGFLSDGVDKVEDDVRLNNYTAKDIMTKKLAKLDPDDKINVALEVFRENLFHAIPVVQNERIVGILTTFDIINNLAKDANAVASYE
ncbi:MAG: CBS domain-containing protein [Saprospiraceae bacterium]|jgi:CBS domain-containing protein|nr:CBS domain-containing protein [Saprospiraceae bacterium]MBK7699962.1 CBS domain-containing protein [Saprospiraceae bacterium]MBK8825569.1 CBS domain-containing protein [Saprospiraceae bacterium]MBK8886208.1 CBS domain-containing protein [Saprospiraceae bacterium]MBK9583911.1 CBS domain-containing protein [Saprospiraceae bacterium]